MRLSVLLTLACSFCFFKGITQTGEPVLLSVTYQFKHINDLNMPSKPFMQDMILLVGKTETRYNVWTPTINNRTAVSNVQKSVATNSVVKVQSFSFVPTVFLQSKGIQDFELGQYTKTNKSVRIVTIGAAKYSIEASLPSFNWKVFPDKKFIGGYACQKAVGYYSGRTYTAWFTPELPFQSGPWKLSGLPGLVLEASDVKGEVFFLFKEINKGDSSQTTALRATRVVKVTEKAFERARDAFEKDPVSFYQGQLPVSVTEKAQIAFKDDNGVSHNGEDGNKAYKLYRKGLKQKRNNPLELEN